MKPCFSAFFVLTALALTGTFTHAQGIDSKGKDFYIAFLPWQGSEIYPSYYLIIQSEEPTSGQFTYTSGKKIQNIYIPVANSPVVVHLDTFNLLQSATASQDISPLSLHAKFDQEVTIYGLTAGRWSSDGFLALPVDALGKSHVVMAYPNTVEPSPSGVTFETSDAPGQFAVVATENNTQVTIMPTVSVNGRGNNTPFTLTLQAGEVFLGQARDGEKSIRAGRDLTGTQIISSRPVVVYGSSERTNIPWDKAVGRDHLVEQLPAVEFWDSSVIAAPHFQIPKTVPDTNIVRILAAYDNTDIIIHKGYQTTLNAGEFYQIPLLEGMHITSNNPILVSQFHNSIADVSLPSQPNDSVGDPFMSLMQGTGQYLRKYVIESPTVPDENNPWFLYHFVNIIAEESTINSMKIDGKSLTEEQFLAFSTIPGIDYRYAQLPLDPGTHTFTANEPFGLHAYGYGVYNSYGFPGGFKFLDPPSGVGRSELSESEVGISIAPQPILSGDALLTLELTERRSFRATLFDADGRLVKELFPNRQFERGESVIPLDLSGLESGLFHCHIEGGDGASRTLSVLVLR